jgi:hypothetical protein
MVNVLFYTLLEREELAIDQAAVFLEDAVKVYYIKLNISTTFVAHFPCIVMVAYELTISIIKLNYR